MSFEDDVRQARNEFSRHHMGYPTVMYLGHNQFREYTDLCLRLCGFKSYGQKAYRMTGMDIVEVMQDDYLKVY